MKLAWDVDLDPADVILRDFKLDPAGLLILLVQSCEVFVHFFSKEGFIGYEYIRRRLQVKVVVTKHKN